MRPLPKAHMRPLQMKTRPTAPAAANEDDVIIISSDSDAPNARLKAKVNKTKTAVR